MPASKVHRATELFLQQYRLKGVNFEETLTRVSKMWDVFFGLKKPEMKSFPLEGKPGMIIVKDHIAWSFCPHHLLPVKYTFKIGYIPNKRVLGLSKPARIADWICTQLPLQEEIAYKVCEEIEQAIEPKGVACVVQGEHLCMRMRGVESDHSNAVSSFVSGVFLISEATRMEFMRL